MKIMFNLVLLSVTLITLVSCGKKEEIVEIHFKNTDGLSLIQRDQQTASWNGYSVTGIIYEIDVDGQKVELGSLFHDQYEYQSIFVKPGNDKVFSVIYKATIGGEFVQSNWSWSEFMQYKFNNIMDKDPTQIDFEANNKYILDIRGSSIDTVPLEGANNEIF